MHEYLLLCLDLESHRLRDMSPRRTLKAEACRAHWLNLQNSSKRGNAETAHNLGLEEFVYGDTRSPAPPRGSRPRRGTVRSTSNGNTIRTGYAFGLRRRRETRDIRPDRSLRRRDYRADHGHPEKLRCARRRDANAIGHRDGDYAHRQRRRCRDGPDFPGTVVTTTTGTYDDQGSEINSTDQFGHETLTTYDQFGRVVDTRTQSVDQNGDAVWLVTQTVYNSQGEVVLATDQYQLGSSEPIDATETIYDSLGDAVQTIRLQGVQVALVNAQTGQPVDPLNPGNAPIESEVTNWGAELSSTATTYNKLGQVTESVAADGETTSYEYDSLGNQTATVGQPVAPASVGLSIPAGDPAGTLVSLRTETTYDSYGNTASTTTNIYEFVLPNGTDQYGAIQYRVLQLDYSDAQTTQYQYDQFGNLLETIYPDGSTTTATYDSNGNQTLTTDQMGQTTQYQYDSENDLAAVVMPAVTNPATGQLVNPTYQYGYDGNGNQTSITDPNGGVTTFTFDSQGNELSRTLPLGQTEAFGYDDQNRQVSHTDFEGDLVDSVFSEHRDARRDPLFLAG